MKPAPSPPRRSRQLSLRLSRQPSFARTRARRKKVPPPRKVTLVAGVLIVAVGPTFTLSDVGAVKRPPRQGRYDAERTPGQGANAKRDGNVLSHRTGGNIHAILASRNPKRSLAALHRLQLRPAGISPNSR